MRYLMLDDGVARVRQPTDCVMVCVIAVTFLWLGIDQRQRVAYVREIVGLFIFKAKQIKLIRVITN
jgi:hypothetical protein